MTDDQEQQLREWADGKNWAEFRIPSAWVLALFAERDAWKARAVAAEQTRLTRDEVYAITRLLEIYTDPFVTGLQLKLGEQTTGATIQGDTVVNVERVEGKKRAELAALRDENVKLKDQIADIRGSYQQAKLDWIRDRELLDRAEAAERERNALRAQLAEQTLGVTFRLNRELGELDATARDLLDEARRQVGALQKALAASRNAWRCFHCGKEISGHQEALDHFGTREAAQAVACVIETTHPLVMKLRMALFHSEKRAQAAEQALARLREQIQRLSDRWRQLFSEESGWRNAKRQCADELDALLADPEPRSNLLKDGAVLIADERIRQTNVKGWTQAHDDAHASGELLVAAAYYMEHAYGDDIGMHQPPWPFEASWWKPSDDPVRDLVKAGALIAAEIDRRLRALLAASSPTPSHKPPLPQKEKA